MIVPNYVPDPMEVPGNVTQEKYPLRVKFIRRVTFLHALTLLVVAGASQVAWPPAPAWLLALCLAGVISLLDMWRIASRGSRLESVVAASVLPLVLGLVAWLGSIGTAQGLPMWAPLVGVAMATIYTAVCGRDFSFVGAFFLSWIASSVAIAALVPPLGMDGRRAMIALAANTLYLFYFEYDLASLLSRRRLGEEWGAVVDLYRDVFNFFGYAVRCYRHWRKHRIWELVR